MTNSEEGFTVVEFFLSIFLTLIVMGVIYSVYRLQIRSLKAQEKRMAAHQYARSVLNLMVREIRNVGHFPLGECTAPANINGIIEADKDLFHFVTDANADSDCGDAEEDIIYRFDIAGCAAGFGNITRQDVNGPNPAAQALTDCNVPVAGGDSLFAYYQKDSTTAYATTPVASADLGNIQRLLITATVESKNPDSEFGGASTAVMKSNVDLRNRGLPQ